MEEFTFLSNWLLWLIAAAILVIVELLTNTFAAFCLVGGGAQAPRLSQQHGCLDRQDNDGDRSNRRQYPRTCAHRRRQLAGCQHRRVDNRRRDKGACDWLRQHHSHRGARRGITS